jgi:site-specific DNA recombinase
MSNWNEQVGSNDILERVTAKRFIGIFKDAEIIDKFDVDLYLNLVDKTTVLTEDLLIVSLLDGTKIKV